MEEVPARFDVRPRAWTGPARPLPAQPDAGARPGRAQQCWRRSGRAESWASGFCSAARMGEARDIGETKHSYRLGGLAGESGSKTEKNQRRVSGAFRFLPSAGAQVIGRAWQDGRLPWDSTRGVRAQLGERRAARRRDARGWQARPGRGIEAGE